MSWMILCAAGGCARHAARETPFQPPADLIVRAARIYTADGASPVVEAIAVRERRVVFAGSNAQALAYQGPATRMVAYPLRTIIPGMIDAHAHLLNLGEALRNVMVMGADTYDEVIRRVVERARETPAGDWILGRGWDQNRWPDKEFPTHDALSRAVPGHPVLLKRVDGHAMLANARAMELAGITSAVEDPAGGRIVRREGSREPTGVFIDNAMNLMTRAVPALTKEETRRALLAAVREANRWGLTGVHDAGVSGRSLEIFEELADSGALTLRVYAMIDSEDTAAIEAAFAQGPRNAVGSGRLWVRSIKVYCDGALGSRGAALLEPYSDDPGNSGLLVSPPEHIRRIATRALKAGFQVGTHAIGDRGNRIVLDVYEEALRDVPTPDHRLRIEHAQVIHPDDIPRFAALGVIPAMQAVHATSDMPWAEARLGPERVRGAYAWRSLLRTGVMIANGSDFPVEEVNPLLSFHAAVTRQDADNRPPGGWYPEERMTREEALKSMTSWAAYAGFQEGVLGSLSPGKYADFVVLDADIMTVPEDQILRTQVVATYLGGQAVYERE